MRLSRRAYAKINLFLSVTGREPNGYHTVENIMQTVSLADTVTLETGDGINGITVLSTDSELGGEADIVWLAAGKYLSAAEIGQGVRISVDKRIPKAAGLGGGSSDAAAALLLLNSAFGRLTTEELAVIAAELGADVPFFLVGGTALCTHYGEVIEPLPCAPELELLIVKAGEKRSTAEMYSLLDGQTDAEACRPALDSMLKALDAANHEKLCSAIYNSFDVAWQDTPVHAVLEKMRRAGALAATVSGSGPSCFGIFPNETAAKNAIDELSDERASIFLCRTVGRKAVERQ